MINVEIYTNVPKEMRGMNEPLLIKLRYLDYIQLSYEKAKQEAEDFKNSLDLTDLAMQLDEIRDELELHLSEIEKSEDKVQYFMDSIDPIVDCLYRNGEKTVKEDPKEEYARTQIRMVDWTGEDQEVSEARDNYEDEKMMLLLSTRGGMVLPEGIVTSLFPDMDIYPEDIIDIPGLEDVCFFIPDHLLWDREDRFYSPGPIFVMKCTPDREDILDLDPVEVVQACDYFREHLVERRKVGGGSIRLFKFE